MHIVQVYRHLEPGRQTARTPPKGNSKDASNSSDAKITGSPAKAGTPTTGVTGRQTARTPPKGNSKDASNSSDAKITGSPEKAGTPTTEVT